MLYALHMYRNTILYIRWMWSTFDRFIWFEHDFWRVSHRYRMYKIHIQFFLFLSGTFSIPLSFLLFYSCEYYVHKWITDNTNNVAATLQISLTPRFLYIFMSSLWQYTTITYIGKFIPLSLIHTVYFSIFSLLL